MIDNNLLDIELANNQQINGYDLNMVRNEFEQNHILYFPAGSMLYCIRRRDITRMPFRKAFSLSRCISRFMLKNSMCFVQTYLPLEVVLLTSYEVRNIKRYISYGFNVKNTNLVNKIKLHGDLLKIKELNLKNCCLDESSSNPHWKVGSLRGGEENCTKMQIRREHAEYTFLGCGENLYRMDDMPGIFFNPTLDNSDRKRVAKYLSLTNKPDDNIRLLPFNNNEFMQIINAHVNIMNSYVIHSTDVAYYIPDVLTGPGIPINVVQYHTFNVYKEGDFSCLYNFASMSREGNHITYKPNGNEDPYEHFDVNIAGVDITKNLVEQTFNNIIFYNINTNYNIDVDILRCYKVTDEMSYITIRITYDFQTNYNGNRRLTFKNSNFNYLNKYNLIDEVDKMKEERNQFSNYKIKKIPNANIDGPSYEFFKKWIDGEEIQDKETIFTIKETNEYSDGFYFFDDSIVFLKMNKRSCGKYNENDISSDKPYYEKYQLTIKIKKEQMNDILNLYRGMSIKATTIKNAINSILNLSKEEWHIPIDYEYAYILAILGSRYVALYNQSINKEVSINNNIYKESIYEEELTWPEKIRRYLNITDHQTKEISDIGYSIVNSTMYNQIMESDAKNIKTSSFCKIIKVKFYNLLLFLNFFYLTLKKSIFNLDEEEIYFLENYNLLKEFLHKINKYNPIGYMMYCFQSIFNKTKEELDAKGSLQVNYKTIATSLGSKYKKYIGYSTTYIILLLSIIPLICAFLFIAIYTFDIILCKDFDYEFLKLITFRKNIDLESKIAFFIFIVIISCLNSHFNPHAPSKLVIYLMCLLYGSFIFPKFKFVLLLVKLYFTQNQSWQFIMVVAIIGNLISAVSAQYTNADYVQKIVYNPGSCTMNDVVTMFEALIAMYKDIDNYAKVNKLTPRIKEKFQVLDIRKPQVVHKETRPNKMPLVQKGFKINGHNVVENEPLKLHDCFYCECEAVYRQIQSKIDYDDNIFEEFKRFIQNKIDVEFNWALYNVEILTKEDYFKKLGVKRHEFEQGYLDYCTYARLIMVFKMHVKIDEKLYMNYKKYKMKARNISAQNKTVKLLMGIVCEILMAVLHEKEWSGPGTNNYQKCQTFKKWAELIGPECGVICADGSAFDSTQHAGLQEIVDKYLFEKVINMYSNFLVELAPISDIKKICFQDTYKIYSKWFTYRVKGTQMSGRMNTCLGNTLRSWAYVEFIKYKLKQKYTWVDINLIREMVNGDDQIIFMKKYLIPLYEEIAYKFVYAKEDTSEKYGLGQIAKIFEKHPDITGAEFLSCYVLFERHTNDFMMVRKPDRFLQLTPFTYNNKHTNIYKFRYFNAELLIADAKNILSDVNVLKFFRVYAEKMYQIGLKEKLELFHTVSDKFKKNVKNKINVIDDISSYKSYVVKTKEQELINVNGKFDKIFEEMLHDKFKITDIDLDEYYKIIESINVNNYLEHFECTIVDKLMDVKSVKEYDKVVKEIDKTRLHVQINLEGNNMQFLINETN